LAFATRSILLTILPTLEAKVEWISQIKPMLLQTRGINLVFITFSLSMALCALVASATFSWIAVGIVFLSSQVVTRLRTRMLFNATLLLHEEVKTHLEEFERRPTNPTLPHGSSCHLPQQTVYASTPGGANPTPRSDYVLVPHASHSRREQPHGSHSAYVQTGARLMRNKSSLQACSDAVECTSSMPPV